MTDAHIIEILLCLCGGLLAALLGDIRYQFKSFKDALDLKVDKEKCEIVMEVGSPAKQSVRICELQMAKLRDEIPDLVDQKIHELVSR